MSEDKLMTVNVATEEKIIQITYNSGCFAEDFCLKLCQHLNIGPVARHLFALRNKDTLLWYQCDFKFNVRDKQKIEFRLRFKPFSLSKLKEIDEVAYEYYFLQARSDLLDNKITDIVYEKHKQELIGLGISDMYRVMLEKGVAQEVVESEYKKYIPKECIRRHLFFIKKPIRNTLAKLSGHDAQYVKEQYLQQLNQIAPNYLTEEYKAIMDNRTRNAAARVLLRVNAKAIEYIQIDNINSAWEILCLIEDLCFITIRDNTTTEVSRKNGIPFYLRFNNNPTMMSFISGTDGYYHLSVKWTFNLCVNAITPSLERLHNMKCHGPIGGVASYAKLEEKRSNRPGTFVIRESEYKYNSFYIDVCGKDGKPRTWRVEKIGEEDFALSESLKRFKSIDHITKNYKDPENVLYLNECLPPSEYDKSYIHICSPSVFGFTDVTADQETTDDILSSKPTIIEPSELLVYKTQPLSKSDGKTNSNNSQSLRKTILYKGMWRLTKGKKMEVAIKLLQEVDLSGMKDFLKIIQKWSKLKSSAIVRLYGTTLFPTTGMVLELVKLGPLDIYLRSNSPQVVRISDLIEAASCLATAVWYLEENDIVHGNIRCRKLLLQEHTKKSFLVKLADPGIFSYLPAIDIHWLPPECHSNTDVARYSTQCDVWAIGTTMWEIFSRGIILKSETNDLDKIKKYYATGKRLPIPKDCPPEVYKIMLECWGEVDGSRKVPQAIMRDIHKISHLYNQERVHSYAVATPKRPINESVNTSSNTNENLESFELQPRSYRIFEDYLNNCREDTLAANYSQNSEPDINMKNSVSNYLDWLSQSGLSVDTLNINNDESLLGNMQSIYEFDSEFNVILQGRIGQGFYGEVYLGMLEKKNSIDSEPQQVAVKKLKIRALEADYQDFQREIEIMKSLDHPNIVKILGVISEPEVCLVMEFVKQGSLQSFLAIYRENLTHKKLLGFSLGIATGMDYLEKKSIVHRDLAARNILISENNSVKISDFGLAQVIGKNDYYILQTNRDLPIKWYAPESLREGKFSPRSDVWSFGITLYEIFSFGEDPKLMNTDDLTSKATEIADNSLEDSTFNLLEALEKGMRLPCPVTCPQEIYVKLIHPCWHIDSHKRPRFLKLCDCIESLLVKF